MPTAELDVWRVVQPEVHPTDVQLEVLAHGAYLEVHTHDMQLEVHALGVQLLHTESAHTMHTRFCPP